MNRLVTLLAAVLIAPLFVGSAHAGSIAPRAGWAVHDTAQGYGELLDSLKAAIKAEGMYLVTQAGRFGVVVEGDPVNGVQIVGIDGNEPDHGRPESLAADG